MKEVPLTKITESKSYAEFVKARLKARGALTRLSEFARMDPAYLGKVLRGQRHFTPEQGVLVAAFLGLSELETRYFLNSVHLSRAGSAQLRSVYERELVILAEQIDNRVAADRPDSAPGMILYASWLNLSVALLTDIPGLKTAKLISKRLSVPLRSVQMTLELLVGAGICRESKIHKKHYDYVGANVLKTGHPVIDQHLVNWRQQAIQRVPGRKATSVHSSAVASVSRADRARIDLMVEDFRKRFFEIAKTSDPEVLCCLNLDWFEV